MRAVFVLVLILGLGLAGFAVYMVQGYFQQQEAALARERAAAAQQVPTVDVYAVNRVITFGEPLTLDDVTVIRYAEPFLPEGVFTTEADLFPEGPGVVRYVTRQMEPNEPVLAVKVTEPGQDAGITTRLEPGMRAFAISVDVASGVSGFLRPGDRVDVYWTGQVDLADRSESVTQLIDQGLQIVAIDQTSDDNMSGAFIARTVTVQVTPQQVAKLAQAQSTGELSLSLVGQMDQTVASAIEVNQRSLLGIVDAAPVIEVVAEPEQVCTIRTRRGSEVVEIPIPCTN
jgi:pilus assembly protein CpaB